jgi:hypothetical protein
VKDDVKVETPNCSGKMLAKRFVLMNQRKLKILGIKITHLVPTKPHFPKIIQIYFILVKC